MLSVRPSSTKIRLLAGWLQVYLRGYHAVYRRVDAVLLRTVRTVVPNAAALGICGMSPIPVCPEHPGQSLSTKHTRRGQGYSEEIPAGSVGCSNRVVSLDNSRQLRSSMSKAKTVRASRHRWILLERN